jgi:hypothetical protein
VRETDCEGFGAQIGLQFRAVPGMVFATEMMMSRCTDKTCKDCKCHRSAARVPANGNFAPVAKPPAVLVRSSLRAAAIAAEQRFKGTMKLLA